MIDNNITVGSDPEIFLEKNGKIKSGIDLIQGTKNEPFPISEDGHFVQIDNIAWEFNIPPSKTKEEFVNNINYVMEYLKIAADAHGLKLSRKTSDEIDEEELKDPRALIFGCEPDFNVYKQEINEPPESSTKLRCVGGHLHLGYPEPNQETSEKIVKSFDIFVTLPSLLLDNDVRRREMYGKAGSFRFKNFGVECRQLSNFWIHDNHLIEWVYEKSVFAVKKVLDNEIDDLILTFSEEVEKVINNNDKSKAKKLIKNINKYVNTVKNMDTFITV